MLFASKAEIKVFLKFLEQSGLKGTFGVKKTFQNTMILAFKAFVKPHFTYCSSFPFLAKCTDYNALQIYPHNSHTPKIANFFDI